jgi:hypothetical protein
MGASMFVWLLDSAGKWLPSGPMILVPPEALIAVTARLQELVAAAPEAERARALAGAAPAVLAVLRAHAAARASADTVEDATDAFTAPDVDGAPLG